MIPFRHAQGEGLQEARSYVKQGGEMPLFSERRHEAWGRFKILN